MVSINFIVNVIVQVLFIFIFLTIFYFTYAMNVEKNIIDKNIVFLIKDIFGIHADSLPVEYKQLLVNKINSIDPTTPENVHATQQINAQNKTVKSKAKNTLIIATCIVICIILGVYVLSKSDNTYFRSFNLHEILVESSVIVAFVAITEICFLTFLGSRVISVDPSIVKSRILNNINNSLI